MKPKNLRVTTTTTTTTTTIIIIIIIIIYEQLFLYKLYGSTSV